MQKLILCIAMIALLAPAARAADYESAVLLLPEDAGPEKTAILRGRLAEALGDVPVTVNPAHLPRDGGVMVAGYGKNSMLQALALEQDVALSEFDLNGDGYVFRTDSPRRDADLAAAWSFLGLYYALDELAAQKRETGRVQPEEKIERPALRLRGITMYDNWNEAYMDSCLAWALANRLNRIELKDTDLDDFIFYEDYPELERFRREGDFSEPGWGDASLSDRRKIERQRRWLESFIRKCHHYDIEVVMWHHEYVVLDRFCEAYPEMCRGDSVLYGSEAFMDFLSSKYVEFFEGPGAEIDGIVLTTVEGNVHLIDYGEELIYDVLDMAYRMCSRYGKKLIFRTFGWDAPQEAKLANVANRLPADAWVMHKHVPMDWMEAFPHNPKLWRVTGHPVMLETEMGAEQRGTGRFPVWAGDYFKYRLDAALPTGLEGVTARINRRGVEDQTGEPRFSTIHDPLYGGSFNPNECNLYTYGRLVWDPGQDVGRIYLDWAEKHYGKLAAPHIVSAFRPMRRTFVQMMYGRGQFLNLRYVMDYEQWWDVMHWGNNLSDFDHSHPVQFRLRLLEEPDDRFFDVFLPEKDRAIGEVTRALGEVKLTRHLIPENEYKALVRYFERMLNLANFCRWQMEAYGWMNHVEGIDELSRSRLALCRDRMFECAEQVKLYDPDYMNNNRVFNIEMHANMLSCIEDVEEALRGEWVPFHRKPGFRERIQ